MSVKNTHGFRISLVYLCISTPANDVVFFEYLPTRFIRPMLCCTMLFIDIKDTTVWQERKDLRVDVTQVPCGWYIHGLCQ